MRQRSDLVAPLAVGVLLAIFSCSLPSFADVRPEHVKCGPDLEITKGKLLKEFFEERTNQKDCQEALRKQRQIYSDDEKNLKKLIEEKAPTDTIDKAEKQVVESRGKFLELVDSCGQCATREISVRKIESPKKTEIWYVSDGSCYLDEKKFGKPAYQKMVDYLSNIDSYPAYRKNGLRNILEFVAVDPESAQLKPEWKTFDKPFYVFIAVLGPTLLNQTFSMQYLIENKVKLDDKSPVNTWELKFNAVPPLAQFKSPPVNVYSAAGKKNMTQPFRLNSVFGGWCLDSQGMMRYYTAADFGTAGAIQNYSKRIARNVLLETLGHVYELASGEKP